ncbi:MAG: 50S ribosomal protein L15 [Phycisphaerae bacterium]|nr:50S ribosomal protein L15 [Phycisphaerae bacterium]
MNITDITTKAGAKKHRKRVGRGEASGRGKTCGRGHKGAGARAGARKETLREGGMFPLFRRLPKFGFNNAQFRTEYQIVNVGDLDERFDDGGHVTAGSLEEAGLIGDRKDLVKILGDGELKKKLVVEAHRFSASAAAKIEGPGGTVTWLGPKPKKKFVKRPKAEAEASTQGEKGKGRGKEQKKKKKEGGKGEGGSEEPG